ncbi:sterol carrier family protein [Marisediminicola antarctica]
MALVGEAAVRQALLPEADRETTAIAVRYLLQVLAENAPGATVEVRVPPFGAVQCVEGPNHTRGTPPNVVETDAATWLQLATGGIAWTDALQRGSVSASGQRADLSDELPVLWQRTPV